MLRIIRSLFSAPKRFYNTRLKHRGTKLKGSLSYIDIKDYDHPIHRAFGSTDMVDNSDWYVKVGQQIDCPLCRPRDRIE